jgi:hypothetical protein
MNTEPFWNISHIEPEENNDCIFWFFDNTVPYEDIPVTLPATTLQQIKLIMRNTMDFSGRSPYGWYEIDAGCAGSVVDGNGATLVASGDITGATDCIQDGRSTFASTMLSAIATLDPAEAANKMLITHPLPEIGTGEYQKPDISFCWYWGCNKHCNHERYTVNQLLLWVSLTMTVVTLFTTLLAGSYAAGKWDVIMPGGAGVAKAPEDDGEKDESNWKNMEIGESNNGVLKKRSRQLRF